MDRRHLLATVLAALAAGGTPQVASAASVDELLAQASGNGTLADRPAALTAQAPQGTLGEEPTRAGGDEPSSSASSGAGSGSGSAGSAADDAVTAAADALPFTGSDPRITLLLGAAALLAGVGLRLRTGDARDF